MYQKRIKHLKNNAVAIMNKLKLKIMGFQSPTFFHLLSISCGMLLGLGLGKTLGHTVAGMAIGMVIGQFIGLLAYNHFYNQNCLKK